MARTSTLLPFRPEIPETDREPRLVSLAGGSAVFDALSSSTARRMLLATYRRPGPASDLADRVDTSIQNASYHLGRLRAVDLVTVADTWYSSKGVEMDVYAPTGEPLLLAVGGSNATRAIERAIEDR